MTDRSRLHRALEAHLPQKWLRDRMNRLRYGPDAPLSDECIWIDVQTVNHLYAPELRPDAPKLRRHDSGRVLAGDWDKARKPIHESLKAQAVRLHFMDGVLWRETPLYADLLTRIASGERPDELTSQADLDARYAALDRLWEELKQTRRLKPKAEMPDQYRREHGGMLIHVGRDGTLMRSGGANHRFAMARLAGLTTVPAQVGGVHLDAVRSGLYARLRQPPG